MQRPPARESRPWLQVLIGLTALVATVVVGAFLHVRPGPNPIDHLGFVMIRPETNSSFFHRVTWFGTLLPLVIGSAGAAIIACFTGTRDRWRALACLVAPPLAATVNAFFLKPAVGRMYFGEPSFASGSVVVVASVAAAWVLAVPRPLRVITATVGSLVAVLMVFAVVALQWHYPSDALAGALFAVGMVVVADGALHVVSRRPTKAGSPGGRRIGRHQLPSPERVELAPTHQSAQPSTKG
jgi:membrane-associated phospholipid phosphatase